MTAMSNIPVTDLNERGIREIARKKVERISAASAIFDANAELQYPRFGLSELSLGKVLGRGGFCVVNDVHNFKIDSRCDWESRYPAEDKDRESICRQALKKKGYAVKQLSDETRLDAHQYLKGLVDLATELKYLAVLDHPNIIKMRAVSDQGAFESEGFFIVLDRLHDTLEHRCFVWRKKKNGISALMSKKVGSSKNRDDLLLTRLGVSLDLCRALLFMHNKSIIYRDLKPENVGFDVHDKVKLFDLGLAREINEAEMMDDGTWNLTGMTGSLRYMAPEVVKWRPYNFSADVYSFGILLWQILSLKMPFQGLNVRTHNELVVQQGARPPIKKSWPESWSVLLQKCWDGELRRRSSLDDIVAMIQAEITGSGGRLECKGLDERTLSVMTQETIMTQETSQSGESLDDSLNAYRVGEDAALDRTIRSDMDAIKKFHR